MNSGKEEYDQDLIDSLEKKYQMFLESSNNEKIGVYLVVDKDQEDNKFHNTFNQSHLNFNNSLVNNNN